MTTESRQIAALFARIGDPFGFVLGPRDADGEILRQGDVSVEGDVITIVVTDRFGRAKCEYSAAVHLVAEDPPDAAAHVNESVGTKRRVRDGWRRLRRIRARRLGT
jgi:hypothetical protein